MRVFAVLAVLFALSLPAAAHDVKTGNLVIDHPHALALPPTVKMGAVYAKVMNNGATPDRLIAVKGDIAKRFEIHTTIKEDGVAKMRELEDGLEIPAGGMALLKQGGNHIMLMGMNEPLVEGTSFPLTLVFEKAGEITLDILVEARGEGGHGHGSHNHGGHKHTD